MSTPATSSGRATAASTLPPRLMIITDQTDLGRALEHHVSIVWPEAECRLHAPLQSGRLHSGFTAAGYDAVILDDRVEHGRGKDWFDNLMHRPGFPPVLYLVSADDPALAQSMIRKGAVECLTRERIDHRKFAAALRDAVERRRGVQALQRGAQAEQLSRFGAVTIRGHRFVRELASGGTSMVYLAESERAGEMVVLKVLKDATGPESPSQFARFLQEYELISKIRHPNVVRIYDLGIADDHAYIAMEYFPLGDLRGRIVKALEPVQALDYLAQLAAALHAVHSVGVLHRDIKPGNVMMRADATLALIDFGLAKHEDVQIEMTATGQIFGTPYYMSPEQGHAQELDERSDLYSLGIVFYEMLAGKKPYVATTPMGVIYMHGNAPIPVLEGELQAYQGLLERLLAKEPADRIASAEALLHEIARIQDPTEHAS
jgi:DNA-binding NarL/FixJ family response regulator